MSVTVEAGDLVARALGAWPPPYDALVVPVPCSGAFAGRLADRLVARWPHLLHEWGDLLALGVLRAGRPHFADTLEGMPHHLVLFPIRETARDAPRLDLIASCLDALPDAAAGHADFRWVAVPRLTEGIPGGPDWEREVRPLVTARLGDMPQRFALFEGSQGSEPAPPSQIPGLAHAPASKPADLAPPPALADSLARRGLPAATLRRLYPSLEPDVCVLTVRGEEWLAHWRTLRALADATGYWPVLLGSSTAAHAHARFVPILAAREPSSASSAAQLIEEARARDAGEWLRWRATDVWRSERGDYPVVGDCPVVGEADREPWPADVEPRSAIADPQEPYGRIAPLAALALAPTRLGWQAPAYLRLSTGNAKLSPADHTRVMARWWERHGAELCSTAVGAEFRVERPPRDRASALALAEEHFVYCPDRVQQGAGTLERLAAQLLGAPVWYFWWD